MRVRTCVYLCNALDERTRDQRRIDSDSPAATAKVLGIAGALRSSGVRAIVLSLGRGRQNGTGTFHRAKAIRIGNTAVVYAPFVHLPIVGHLVGLLGLMPLVWRLRPRGAQTSLLVFNRLPHYSAALLLAWILGYRRFLDLEDGDLGQPRGRAARLFRHVVRGFFDWTCPDGALVAARPLESQIRTTRIYPLHGVATAHFHPRDWTAPEVIVLLGGSLEHSRGARLFAQAIRLLRSQPGSQAEHLRFVITGKGPAAAELERLETEPGRPMVTFEGTVSRDAYLAILSRAHIGLVLNLPSSDLATTTFPSKVVELAEQGLLVLSTRVSDVHLLLGEDGALWLDEAEPSALAERLLWSVQHREQSRELALTGQQRVASACAPAAIGKDLAAFLFE